MRSLWFPTRQRRQVRIHVFILVFIGYIPSYPNNSRNGERFAPNPTKTRKPKKSRNLWETNLGPHAELTPTPIVLVSTMDLWRQMTSAFRNFLNAFKETILGKLLGFRAPRTPPPPPPGLLASPGEEEFGYTECLASRLTKWDKDNCAAASQRLHSPPKHKLPLTNQVFQKLSSYKVIQSQNK